MQTQEKRTVGRTETRAKPRAKWVIPSLVGAVVIIAAIGLVGALSGGDSPVRESVEPVADQPAPTTATPSTVATTTPSTLVPEPAGIGDQTVAAFFSFDSAALADLPWWTGADTSHVLDAQSWAEGANYEIEASSCVSERAGLEVCEVTVSHDFGRALGYESDVTFIVRSVDGEITEANFREPDPVLHDLFRWAEAAHPEQFGPDGTNCRDDAGSAECAAAYAVVAEEYALTEEFMTR